MRIYLDHNATTPLRREVVQEMLRVLESEPGNPSSTHAEGAAARATTERARVRVARSLNVAPGEVWFTAGATEANNSVLRGLLGDPSSEPAASRHVVTTQTEHPSVRAPLEAFEARGHRVTWLRVDADGRLDPAAVTDALQPDTALVSIIWANNETGVIQPIREVAKIAADRDVLLHVDAVQAAGKIPFDFSEIGADFLSLSAHKLGGPQGIGALIARPGIEPAALLQGGTQEHRLRAGTENAAGITGFGLAAELALSDVAFAERVGLLRDQIEAEIMAISPETRIFGKIAPRLPNTSCLTMPGVSHETQLIAFDLAGIAVSSGSACSSGKVGPSHVLAAMGVPDEEAGQAIRVSFGWASSKTDAERFIKVYNDVFQRSRARQRADEPAAGYG